MTTRGGYDPDVLDRTDDLGVRWIEYDRHALTKQADRKLHELIEDE